MIGNILDKTINGLVKYIETFVRIFLDHNHDGINTSEISSSGSVASGYASHVSTDANSQTIVTNFLPKLIVINAVGQAVTDGISQGQWDSSSGNRCIANYNYSGVYRNEYENSFIIYVVVSGAGSVTAATVSAVSSNGFTITWASENLDIRYLWQAFG